MKPVDSASNANLDMLGIKPYDFSGFKYGTTSYKVDVPADTETIEVYATAQEKKSTVTGTGKKTLKEGENRFDVVVTAQNGKKRTYTITVVRGVGSNSNQTEENNTTEEKEEPQENLNTSKEEEEKGLAELKIGNVTLSPAFSTNQYEYTVTYIGEDKKLEIETKPTKEDYEVEVMGNEDLQEGENTITVLVSEKNGNNVATYQITVNKSLVDQTAMSQENNEEEKKQFPIMTGMIIAVVLVVIIAIGTMIIRKRNRRREDEFLDNPYYEDYDDYDETPRAFRGTKFEQVEKRNSIIDNIDRNDKIREEAKEQYLNGYTSGYDMDFSNSYQGTRHKDKHRGKRFK